MSDETIRGRKRAAAQARRASASVRRRRERRCFWTWPFGHLWRRGERVGERRCEVCDAYRFGGV